MAGDVRSRRHRWASRLLVSIGLACVAYYSVATVRTWRYQRAAKSQVEQMIGLARPPAYEPASGASRPLEPGEIIGRVDIPRLKLSAAIAEGDDERTLGTAIGHLPDTPLPWDRRGNVALAAHRDGLFRPLEKIRLGDDVRVRTPRGEYHYKVTKTHIVDPDDVWVIAPTHTPTITLITCYPFSFVGNAPRRFIVHAELAPDIGTAALAGSVVQ
jgi:sortase A